MEKISALEDALAKKSLVGIYSVFYTVAHGDPNFSTGKFRKLLEYVKSRGIDNLFQEYDGEEFEPEDKWDEDYWALIASSLVDNFCVERIDHLEQVGKKVYPIRVVEIPTPVHNCNINETTRRVPNQPINNTYNQMNSHSTRIISDERKKGVKFGHMNKTRKDDGGFMNKLFGPR